MSASLADSLAVLLSSQTPDRLYPLFSSTTIQHLHSTAAHLPPILRGGFECRLDARQTQVDLQQCIASDVLELKQLDQHIERLKASKNIPRNSGWNRLQAFLKIWPESISDIQEIWLEYDVVDSIHNVPIPSLFVGFPQKPFEHGYQLANRVINTVADQTTKAQADALAECFKACQGDAFISHIGLMDARQDTKLRVNIKRLDANSLPVYLKTIAWPGCFSEIEALCEQLFEIADRVTVCIDLADQICPNISLECIFLGQPTKNIAWSTLLDLLVEHDLCSDNKRDALLDWPAQLNPANTEQHWPAHLVAESLLKHQHCFTQFERRLSHVKISLQPQKTPQAKAYLWFQHQWNKIEHKE